jgi:hypothetical protein
LVSNIELPRPTSRWVEHYGYARGVSSSLDLPLAGRCQDPWNLVTAADLV